MRENEKKEIIKMLFNTENLEEKSYMQLKMKLNSKGFDGSLKTIAKYKKMVLEEINFRKREYGILIKDDEAIKNVLKKVLTNENKVEENKPLKNKIEIAIRKNIINDKNIYRKKLREEVYKYFNNVPKNTFDYLYNDIAKKLKAHNINIRRTRGKFDFELKEKIALDFENNKIEEFIWQKYNHNDHNKIDGYLYRLTKEYILEEYNISISIYTIKKYYTKYYRQIALNILRKSLKSDLKKV